MARKKTDTMALYRRVFGSEDGQIVLQNLLQEGGWLRSTFSTNQLNMAYNCGKRDLALGVLNTLSLTPKQLESLAKRMNREDMDEII